MGKKFLKDDMADYLVQKTVLNNGIRILTEKVPNVRSVALGFWLDVGSRDEAPQESGISHFVEHMLFKGTQRYSALDIARIFDQMGGMANAYTSKEATCYYARVLDRHLEKAIATLSELILHPSFDENELLMEREVILQEIKMVLDTPDEFIYDLFGHGYWPESGLGRPVLGVPDTILSMTSNHLRDFVKKRYVGPGLVISAAGHVDHEKFVELACTLFSSLSAKKDFNGRSRPVSRPMINVFHKELEQTYILLGFDGPSSTSSDRYATALFNVILGGSMSSRLFQEVREKRGLTYSIHSFVSSYQDTGLLGISVVLSPEKVKKALDVILGEMETISKKGVSEEELDSAREHARGELLLSLENMETRMIHLAKGEMLFNRSVSYREILEGMDAVSTEHIKALARNFLDSGGGIVGLGPVKDADFNRYEGLLCRSRPPVPAQGLDLK